MVVSGEPLHVEPFVGAIERITESDDEIRIALADARDPPLLPALAYLTGDLSLLRDDLRPDPLLWPCPRAGSAKRRSPKRARWRSRP